MLISSQGGPAPSPFSFSLPPPSFSFERKSGPSPNASISFFQPRPNPGETVKPITSSSFFLRHPLKTPPSRRRKRIPNSPPSAISPKSRSIQKRIPPSLSSLLFFSLIFFLPPGLNHRTGVFPSALAANLRRHLFFFFLVSIFSFFPIRTSAKPLNHFLNSTTPKLRPSARTHLPFPGPSSSPVINASSAIDLRIPGHNFCGQGFFPFPPPSFTQNGQ